MECSFAACARGSAVDAMLLGTVLLWALNITVTKYVFVHGWPPLAYGTIRYFAAIALFWIFTYRRERSFRIARRRRAARPARRRSSSSSTRSASCTASSSRTRRRSALLLGSTPVFIGLITVALGLEQLAGAFWIGALITFAGVGLVAAGSGSGFSGSLGGDLLAVCTALHLGRLHGLDRAADAPLLAVPDQRARARDRLGAARARSSIRPGRGRAVLLRLEGLARLRLRGRRAALPDEHPLVHRDRPGRPVPRLAVREPAAVLRRLLRARPALGDPADRSSSRAAS